MATHSSILAWRIPWTEEPGGLQSMGWQRWTGMKQFSTHAGPPRSKMLLRLFVKIQSFFATASNKLSFALAKLNVGGKAKLNGGEFLGSQHSLYLLRPLGS